MKFNKAQTDLLWVAACLLLYVFLAFEFEFSEQIFQFTQSYERLQLDEMPELGVDLQAGNVRSHSL